jgi:hypothetical protein
MLVISTQLEGSTTALQGSGQHSGLLARPVGLSALNTAVFRSECGTVLVAVIPSQRGPKIMTHSRCNNRGRGGWFSKGGVRC